MSEDQQVAIITGGSQGIGPAWPPATRQQGWAVVATSRTIKPSADPDVLTVDGDVFSTAWRSFSYLFRGHGRRSPPSSL